MKTMKYKTIILPEAAQDFKEAKNWYKKTKVQGLNQRFANAIKTAINDLRERPAIYAIRYKNVRIVHTDQFPYAIHYFIDGDLIVITSILYAGRDPKISSERV